MAMADCIQSARATYRPNASAEDRAFFYTDGIPTKGAWLDLDTLTDWDDVIRALGLPEGYGGDVQCADVEGELARCCYSSRRDSFDLAGYQEISDAVLRQGLDSEAVAAFIDWYGSFDADAFSDAYQGQYDDAEAFTWQYVDDCGMLADVPETVQQYFDYAAFAHDLFIDSFYIDDSGHVFARI